MARRSFLIAGGLLALSLAPVGAQSVVGSAGDVLPDDGTFISGGVSDERPANNAHAVYVAALESRDVGVRLAQASAERSPTGTYMPESTRPGAAKARGPPITARA